MDIVYKAWPLRRLLDGKKKSNSVKFVIPSETNYDQYHTVGVGYFTGKLFYLLARK